MKGTRLLPLLGLLLGAGVTTGVVAMEANASYGGGDDCYKSDECPPPDDDCDKHHECPTTPPTTEPTTPPTTEPTTPPTTEPTTPPTTPTVPPPPPPPTTETPPPPPPPTPPTREFSKCVGNALVTTVQEFIHGEWVTVSSSAINGDVRCVEQPPGVPPVIEEGM